MGGATQISPGTFTRESIDQSFAGEEGPTGGSTDSRGGAPSHSTRDLMATGGIVGLYR